MRIHTGIKKRCNNCKIIRRHGRLMVVCSTKRHKQAQSSKKRKISRTVKKMMNHMRKVKRMVNNVEAV